MTRFANVLEQARERLQIPEPARTRILLEMASDLEDSYQHYLGQGCDQDEAARRAEEVFGSSEEALQLLERVYHAGFGGVGERFTQQIGTLWSKVLMVALLAFEILLAYRILSDRTFFVYPSPFLWPIAALALAAFLFTIWKLVQIFSRLGTDWRRLRTGLGIPLFFAGATLAVTALGFLFHMQRFFRLNSEGAPETLFMNFAGWMVSISSMMTMGLLTATLAGLLWFVLSRLVARSEAREIEGLLHHST
jgi:hypothetical protein